jgi:LacI family transcriptional regulator
MRKQITRRNETPHVNLKCIASEVGLSIMTVSRALRGHGDIAKETRERVLKVADGLGYRPNMLVRAIQTGQSKNIGVIISVQKAFGSALVSGIHDALSERDYLPLVHWKKTVDNPDPDECRRLEVDVIHQLLDRRVDGIILLPSDESISDAYFSEVWKRGVPLVTIDRKLRKGNFDFVGTDNTTGGRVVAKHLLELGHRRVAHVSAQRIGNYAERRVAFEAALKSARATCISILADEEPNPLPAIEKLFNLKPLPTAVFVASDYYVPPLFAMAAARGIRIPEDLSVVGYADLHFAKYLTPPLTTVAQNPYEIGRRAATTLLQRLAPSSEGPPVDIRLTPELIVRGSTAKVRAE